MKIHAHYSSMGTRLSLILYLFNCLTDRVMVYITIAKLEHIKFWLKSCIELFFCPLHTRTHTQFCSSLADLKLILRLEQPAIVCSILFGKYEKSHACNALSLSWLFQQPLRSFQLSLYHLLMSSNNYVNAKRKSKWLSPPWLMMMVTCVHRSLMLRQG